MATMLAFRTLLELANIDPAEALIVRHSPTEKSLKQVLPWLAMERPELFLAYQRVQWQPLEKAMTRGKYIASFIGQQPSSATFAGLYRIAAWETLSEEGYWNLPGNRELATYGMTGRSPDMPDCLAFELERLELYTDWLGRLIVSWPKPYQQWWRWASGGVFPVEAIATENLFVRAMPEWQDLVLSWAELQNIPAAWRSALAQWRGIYFIYDSDRQAGYVGSAYGQENILGRWRHYAKTGHGGNSALRASKADNLTFSILQLTSPDLDLRQVVELETSWKKRLHTRDFGLNRN